MNAGGSCDLCLPFFGLLHLTCHFENRGIGVLWMQFHLTVRKPNFLEATKRLLHNLSTVKCATTAISGGVDIPDVLQCHLLQQISST